MLDKSTITTFTSTYIYMHNRQTYIHTDSYIYKYNKCLYWYSLIPVSWYLNTKITNNMSMIANLTINIKISNHINIDATIDTNTIWMNTNDSIDINNNTNSNTNANTNSDFNITIIFYIDINT